jgi:hypothetical protein
VVLAVCTLWAYGKVHTYATGQDPRTYLVLAKTLLRGGTDGGGNAGLVVPGWPLVLAGVMKVFGVHAAFWTNVPLFVLLIGLLGTLAGRLSGSWRQGAVVAAGSALLMLGGYEHNPHFLLWAFRQTPIYLTALLSLLCLERAVSQRVAGRPGAAAGWLGGALAWVAAGVLVRETGVLVLPAMGLYLLADALGWIGPEGSQGRGRWLLIGAFAGIGVAGALVVAVLWKLGLLSGSAQVGYLMDILPYVIAQIHRLKEPLGWIPEELGWGGCLALAVGVAVSVRRRHRAYLLLFLVPAVSYLFFDGLIKAHRRFFLSALFFLSPVAMLGAFEAAKAAWLALQRCPGWSCKRRAKARMAGWCAAWAALAAWCAAVVVNIRPWGVQATRTDVARALETISPWIGEGRPLLLDGRARFLADVVAVFTDWPVLTVHRGNASWCVQEPPLAFVRPENRAALHWAAPGPPADRILERWGRLVEVPGGGAFHLGAGNYRVLRAARWEGRRAVHSLPPPPESGMSPAPPSTLLRLEAPACAAEMPVRASIGGVELAGRLDPGTQFLAIPRELTEAAAATGGRLELQVDADVPIPEDFRPVWLHPDGPLEMQFGPVEEPSSVSYLSEEFRQFDGLEGLDREFPFWPAPLQAREFGGDGEIRLPEGVGEAGAAYSVKLSVAPVHEDPGARLAVAVSLPEFPEIAPAIQYAPQVARLHTCTFELGRLPRPPRVLHVHVDSDAQVPESIRKNPRHANVQLGALVIYARRDVDSLRVRVGNPEDGELLGEGFFRREHEGAPEHGRWTGGRAEVYLPLKGGRDCRLELDYSLLRPVGVAPAVPRLSLNGHPLETEATDAGLAAGIPAGWLADPNLLLIETETWSPADRGAGDDRELGIFLREIRAAPF